MNRALPIYVFAIKAGNPGRRVDRGAAFVNGGLLTADLVLAEIPVVGTDAARDDFQTFVRSRTGNLQLPALVLRSGLPALPGGFRRCRSQ